MDPVKEAFLRIKEDITKLREEIKDIRQALLDLYDSTPTPPPKPGIPLITDKQTDNLDKQTYNLDKQTDNLSQQTKKYPLESSYSENISFSTGNQGVPTDRQTDKQTDRHSPISTGKPQKTDFERASEVLNSLDSLKKGIRLKFKQLTKQELLVFSSLYALEDQNIAEITYKTLADRLNLSESSIRDYINKLTKKGVPILKTKLNNKTILLNIDQNLKNIATLETILKLREL